MHPVVESLCAEICAHARDSSEQHSFAPPSGIELLTSFSRTALYASLLARPLHNLHTSITQSTFRIGSEKTWFEQLVRDQFHQS